LTPGHRLESKTGLIHVIVADDLLAYGASLIGKQAVLEAGGAIKGLAIEKPEPIRFDGELVLQASSGIGGFGFDRVLVQAMGPNASVAATNGAQGDVVIAATNGLTLSGRGVRSDSDGMVALLAGAGTVNDSGPVWSGSGRVVRLSGLTWMSHNDATATSMLLDSLHTESGPDLLASPLDRLNRLLKLGSLGKHSAWDSDGRLSSAAELLSVQAPGQKTTAGTDWAAAGGAMQAMIGAFTGALHGARPLVSITSTHQLLEAAMTLTLQGRHPALDGAEPISSWVNRVTADPPAQAPDLDASPEPATLPPAPVPPEGPKPERSDDAIDGSQESDRSLIEPIAWMGDSQVRWLLPIGTTGSWTQSPPNHLEPEHSGWVGEPDS
jgi:hypothetical protein